MNAKFRNSIFIKHLFLTVFLCSTCLLQTLAEPIILTNAKTDFSVKKNHTAFFEDTSRKMTIVDVATNKLYFRQNIPNWQNKPQSSAFWLKLKIVNNCNQKTSFRIELYDYDIDEVSVYFQDDSGNYLEKKSGYLLPFASRELAHKNVSFDLPVRSQDTLVVYLRLFSSHINTLTPVIRSYERLFDYSLHEYILLGIFYGFMLLIILYNFIYYLILRSIHYLYYVGYVVGIVGYLVGKNGTGFQYIWPSHPEINIHIEVMSISMGIVCLLLFSNSYLELAKSNKRLQIVILSAIVLKIILVLPQLSFPYGGFSKFLDIIFIQIAFYVGILAYKSGNRSAKWYILAFVILNTSFFISWLEHLNWLKSNTWNVYAPNIGVALQSIFLTIGLAETVKDSYLEKNRVLSELILAIERNESMRILELKRQMNPHFIFNALNSILQRILTEKKEEAAKFLMNFAKLIRKTLDIADKIFIPLTDEIENLRLYLSIESMRLGNSFSYEIVISEKVNADDIDFPALTLQPFVENAIWHGLMPQDGVKVLKIEIDQNGQFLEVTITDNGIGREKAALEKRKPLHVSKGIKLIAERLELIQLKFKRKSIFSIIDLYDSQQNALGTRVYFKIEIE